MSNTKTGTAGFTFIELMIVVVIMGLMAATMAPSVARGFAGAARRSANREVTAALFRARAIAIQRSRGSRVVRTGNALQVWVTDTSGTLVPVGGSRDVGELYGVTLLPTAGDTLQFDPRGFVVIASQTKLTLTKGSAVDTVCVLGLGRITNRGC